MASDGGRRWLIGGVLLATVGCATSEDLSIWREHHTHFASAEHLQFSLRNRQGQVPHITEQDTATAEVEDWWGQSVPAEEVPRQPATRPDVADIAGRWTGSWSSAGVGGYARGSIVVASFTQSAGTGEGMLIFSDSVADEAVPYSIRWAGSFGVPVAFSVAGSEVSLEAMRVSQPFTATLRADGDELIGRIGSAQVRLTRSR